MGTNGGGREFGEGAGRGGQVAQQAGRDPGRRTLTGGMQRRDRPPSATERVGEVVTYAVEPQDLASRLDRELGGKDCVTDPLALEAYAATLGAGGRDMTEPFAVAIDGTTAGKLLPEHIFGTLLVRARISGETATGRSERATVGAQGGDVAGTSDSSSTTVKAAVPAPFAFGAEHTEAHGETRGTSRGDSVSVGAEQSEHIGMIILEVTGQLSMQLQAPLSNTPTGPVTKRDVSIRLTFAQAKVWR